MDMMKEIKNRPLSLTVFLVALVLVVVASAFIAVHRNKLGEDSKSILEHQRFIVVADSIDKNQYNHNFEIGIDLKIRIIIILLKQPLRMVKNLENFQTFLHLIVITVFYMRKLPPQF